MILSAGQSFGAYTILAPLGRGGMGEVYRARDRRLGREVALKILREDTAHDPNRLGRFEQEARAASALNHPNLVVVYEIGDARIPGRDEPLPYMAMELLGGTSLATVLARERLPLRRVLEIACQIADGLARAHESGIVHRDLKPSNILVDADDRVKILDFGLAKLRPELAGEEEALPTVTDTLTAPGVAVGTPAYMSPEQARGEPAAAASDQFSFGCVFYEMLCGRSPFAAASNAETISAILRDDPEPIERGSPNVPPMIRWVVERCLVKAPAGRYVSTRDLARELQTFREHSEFSMRPAPAAAPDTSRRGLRRRWLAAAAVVAIAAGAVALLLRVLPARPEPDFRRLTFRRGVVWRGLFAPKSDTILYTATWEGVPARTYLTIPQPAGNDRGLDAETQLPMAYAADGSEVLVLLGRSRAAINARGTLAWWPALGGKPRPILQNAGWADWAETPRLLAVVRDTGAERVLDVRKADGTLERSVFRTTGGISYVRFSPDGERIAFIHHPSRYDDAGEVRLAETRQATSRALTPRFERCVGLDWNERTGDVWFTASRANVSASSLWRVSPSGRLRPLQSLPDFFALQDVDASGRRCLLVSSASGMGLRVRLGRQPAKDLTWLGFSGIADVSPDKKTILFSDGAASEKSRGSWMRPIEGGDAIRLAAAVPGSFSPDGRSIVGLTPPASGPPQLVLIPVGAGVARQLTFSQASHSMPSFAGSDTVLFVRSAGSRSEVWRIAADGTGAAPLGAKECIMPFASPSGDAFLCRGADSHGALFVFPMAGGAGRKLYQPDGTIIHARWSGTGADVYAVTRDLRLLTIDARTGDVRAVEPLDLGEAVGPDSLIGAALSPDASIQAYSFDRFSSGLYIAEGL